MKRADESHVPTKAIWTTQPHISARKPCEAEMRNKANFKVTNLDTAD
jgi:hypothetical protein